MAIPQEILNVERPSSTRVKKSGDRYLVIKRTCKRVNGRNVPVELGTIGEIIDGKYVELRSEPRKKRNSVDIKDYGEVAFFNKAAGDLFSELAAVFDIKTAKQLFVIALLRVSDPDIKNRDLKFAYETSFASEIFPGVPLSENTVSKLLLETGMLDSIVSPLSGYKDSVVFFKKKKISENCFLYAFRDPKTAAEQEMGCLLQTTKKGTFTEEKMLEKQKEFGTIVFESKFDISPLDVYEAYAKRWEIEIMFSMYKS